MRPAPHLVSICGAFGLALIAIPTAQADVTLTEKTSVEGAGMLRMGNMNGTTTTSISGHKARIESDMEMQSRMVRMLAHGALGPTAQIVRLDEDKAFDLKLKKKEYTEESISARSARLKQAMQQASSSQPPVGGVDESQCDWQEPKADVKRTGETANVAGFDAERVTVTASQACRDRKTGSVCEFSLLLDQWVSPKFAGGDDAQAFYTAYAQQMGVDAQSGMQRAETMFGRYKGVWAEVASKMRDIKGYPVRSSFGLAIGGPQCQSNSGQAQANGGGSAEGGGSIAAKIAGSIFNRKKSNDSAGGGAQAPAAPNGFLPLITVRSELVSVSNDAVPASAFEVPADFKQIAVDAK
jgi:hypothetical protein